MTARIRCSAHRGVTLFLVSTETRVSVESRDPMKPFRVSQPLPVNANATKAIPAPPPGHPILQARKDGNYLPDGSEDLPSYNPRIPWPQPAGGADDQHVPFKGTK